MIKFIDFFHSIVYNVNIEGRFMNKKGQALVEFVLILPILIFILLAIIDISRLMIMKNHLETLLGDVKIDTTKIEDYEYEVKLTKTDKEDKILVELESCLDITTPGLNKILGDPACVTTSKNIEKE